MNFKNNYLKKLTGLLTLSALIAIGTSDFNIATASHHEDDKETGEVHTHNVSFDVDGMHCGHCEARIKNALKKTDGIIESNVDFEAKEARASYDPDKLEESEIREVITDLGFEATVKGEEDAKSCSPGCMKDCCA